MFTPNEMPVVLSEDQLERIHVQALDLLQNLGMRVHSDQLQKLMAEEGNMVDGDLVKFDREWVMERVALAPAVFDLHARNPERTVSVGDGSLILLPVGGSPFAEDLERGRRSGTTSDHDELIKLAHASDVITALQAGTVEPQEQEVAHRHLATDYSTLRWSDKPYVSYGGAGFRGEDSLHMASIAFGGKDVLDQKTCVSFVINPVSPLVWDDRMCELLIVTAEAKQALIVTPFLLAGGTAPVSLSGALSIQVAEALSGIAIAQAITPGLPCMFGSFFTPLDMRSGAPAFGLPQGVLATLAGAQFSRKYAVPYRGGGGLCSGTSVDAQTGTESANSLWATFLGASDFVLHAAGWLEGGLVASFEKFAIDIEVCKIFKGIRDGIGMSDEEMALDAITAEGPGGMFLGSGHTMEHFKEYMMMSPLFPTPDFNTWDATGRETMETRATAQWHTILDSYEDPGMDSAAEAELTEFVARRKAEPIPDDE